METEPVLQMRNIRKTFPGVIALDDVSFDLRRGEVHILLGENGAGKSTLMKILSGAYERDGGEVLIDGREVEIGNPRRSQSLGIGIIYQELNLVPHLSAAENIYLGREPSRAGLPFLPFIVDRKAMNGSARELLAGLGVNLDVRRPVGELSIAEQQMVEIAKAVSLDARILIMDEPTAVLTEREIRELFARIRRLKADGVSIIYISHRMEELFEIGDRVTVLRDGSVVGTRDIAGATKPELIRMMVNRELTQQFPKVAAPRGKEVLRVEGLNRAGVLTDISFSLCEGEILGVAGLLGSGRTELARAIFGLDRIDSGGIHIKGRLQRIASPRRAINLGLGFLTEDRKTQGLVLPLSVRENICLPSVDAFSRMGVVSRRREAEAAAKYRKDLRIKTTGLEQRVVNLSGGNQQKVVLSKWLVSRGDILIFDEPTRGIDVGSKAEIYELMNKLTAAGAAIIMISSDLPEVLGMSDRILVMHQGRINGEFSAAEATQEKILHRALGDTE
ncbi:MAG: sugar ABC transporter ATP-binding protein [Acidobacteria bacterium]|nr:sugar ABC transporter ATP-binding protein [Acidobacteriota bacterium]